MLPPQHAHMRRHTFTKAFRNNDNNNDDDDDDDDHHHNNNNNNNNNSPLHPSCFFLSVTSCLFFKNKQDCVQTFESIFHFTKIKKILFKHLNLSFMLHLRDIANMWGYPVL